MNTQIHKYKIPSARLLRIRPSAIMASSGPTQEVEFTPEVDTDYHEKDSPWELYQ